MPALMIAYLLGFTIFFVGKGEYLTKNPIWILVPLVVCAAFIVAMKRIVWILADEVDDAGDYLVVQMRGETEKIALANVMHVDASFSMQPKRITLRLLKPGRFGKEIAFCPLASFTFNPFAKNKVAEDLIVRVDQARSRRDQ